jgi:hypothetical protein
MMFEEQWSERDRRRRVALLAFLKRKDGSLIETSVSDLSLDGCQVCTPLTIAEVVELTIEPIGKLTAQVRWSLMGQSGLRFLAER